MPRLLTVGEDCGYWDTEGPGVAPHYGVREYVNPHDLKFAKIVIERLEREKERNRQQLQVKQENVFMTVRSIATNISGPPHGSVW